MPDVEIEIPRRALFNAAEVCDLAKVQPYVLRSWEAEFPQLGVAKSAGGPRTYRREDVAQVLRIKHLLLVEGLTLAGARRRLEEESAPVAAKHPPQSNWPRGKIPFASAPRLVRAVGAFGGRWALASVLAAGPA